MSQPATDCGVIAILGGTGPEGMGLGTRWAHAGLSVVIGSRDGARAQAAADAIRQTLTSPGRRPRPHPLPEGEGAHDSQLVTRVEGLENADAAAAADTVVLAVPYAAQLATLKSVQAALRAGQVLIDVTVPLETAVGGRATRLVGVWSGSAAEQAAATVPRGVTVAAAFHQVSAHHLMAIERPVDCDVLVCGDDRAAKERVRGLVEAIPGCRYVDAGPLANARIVESLTALLIGINLRYKIPGAGIRITGLPDAQSGPRNAE